MPLFPEPKDWLMRNALALLAPSLLAIASCSGGDSSGGGNPPPVATVTPTPTPSVSPTPTPTPVPSASPTPTGTDFLSRAAALYTVQPDIAACQAGTLHPAVTASLLTSLNNVRALHRLPPVVYSPSDEASAQQSALIMAANGQLSHTPPASWACYSSLGASGAAASNLYGGVGTGLTLLSEEQIVAGFMTEINNLVIESVGHRRWLLDPFLGSVAYGRVAGRYQTSNRADAAAIKVFNLVGPSGPSGALPAIVAYPYEEYPARFFDTNALLSFSVISNTTSKFGNTNVNFSGATISVRVRGGAALTVSRVAYDNEGYGLPNNLQFAVAGLTANTIYDVTISNVIVAGTPRSYSYYFRIVA
ncbi:CAP domain-containing protein [Sphingomonas sp.]|uniref:CAP domain-containing protein n=1 Tax=Sphingomonas sp. TaxID=28214 RepID=UPI002EDA370F